VRGLKATFDEVKKKNEEKVWEHGLMMRFIFYAPLEEGM